MTDAGTTYRRTFVALAMVACALGGMLAQDAGAQCLLDKNFKGVNLAGAEFNSGKVPGVHEKDYTYPNQSDLDYVVALGGNSIRLPFRWERVQPVLGESLDAGEVRRIEAVVKAASARKLCVILDVHNYGTYRAKPIGTETVPAEAFHDLWLRLAEKFSNPDQTMFGLMNEPAKLPLDIWAGVAQSTVNALRKKGAENIIIASGGRWSGAHEWFRKFGPMSNAEAFADLKDPLKRTWIEVHQYADANFSGTGQECVDTKRFKPMFERIAAWADQHGQQLYLGEFGVPPNENCLAALDEMLEQMQRHKAWRGWAYWAAGRWWGNYSMSIQMKDGQEKPQAAILRKYFVNAATTADGKDAR